MIRSPAHIQRAASRITSPQRANSIFPSRQTDTLLREAKGLTDPPDCDHWHTAYTGASDGCGSANVNPSPAEPACG